jgi:large subunit ribosomal protein L31
MKTGIHPEYHPEAQVTCTCGNTWTVGSTAAAIRTDVCSKCHPFFTGEQRIVDAGGQVERFMKKLERRDRIIAQAEQEKARGTSPELPVMELDIGARAKKILVGAGITTVGDVLAYLEEGEDKLTNLSGFGLKSLATLKKRLRSSGFALPGDEMLEEASAEEASAEAVD